MQRRAALLLTRFMAGQLARPSGLFGRWMMGGRLNRLNAVMNELTFEQLQPVDGSSVLEIGFGGGALLTKLLSAGATVAGADISPEMVARGLSTMRHAVEAGRADLQVSSVEALPFAACSFDKVCTVNTIYFWPDMQAALHEVRRVLRPGGSFAICFNPEHELRKWPGHKFGFALYAEEAVEQLLAGAGFQTISTSRRHDPDQGEIACVSAVRP
jgi:SAM-dependent methyltransferase